MKTRTGDSQGLTKVRNIQMVQVGVQRTTDKIIVMLWRWGAKAAVEGPKVEGHTVTGASEVVGSNHHGGGAQRVAGASEVVPFDAVEFPDVVAHSVVNTIEVGEPAGIKPPT